MQENSSLHDVWHESCKVCELYNLIWSAQAENILFRMNITQNSIWPESWKTKAFFTALMQKWDIKFKAETHDATNRCDTSPRQVAATNRLVTCENHCRCDITWSLRFVARIRTGLSSCDISQRQNSASNRVDKATCRRDVSPYGKP